MNDEKQREVHDWLAKSQSDLGSARRLLEGSDPFLDTAVYHCQQAAEKALKAFLVYHDRRPQRTHDLTELVGEAIAILPAFELWLPSAEELTPYAVQFRYPGELLEPEEEEATRAFEQARLLCEFIRQQLPAEPTS